MKTRRLLGQSPLALRSFTAAVFLTCNVVAQADNGTWTLLTAGSATGPWSDAATGNWLAGIVADGSGSTADFSTLNVTANSTVTLSVPRTISNLTFGDLDNTSAGSWTLAGTAPNNLTLAGSTPTITVNGLNANSLTTISAIIEGTAGMTKAGSNILALGGANTYSGGTTISTGSVRALNNTAFGSGTVTVASGARLQLSGNVNVGNTINLNGTSALYGNLGANILSGSVTLQSNSSLTMNAQNDNNLDLAGSLSLAGNVLSVTTVGNTNSFVNISGTINGSGTITKTGSGTLTIVNNQISTYSGNTTLTGGGLAFGNDGALGTGTLTFGVNDSSVAMRSSSTATRTLANALILAGNGGTNAITTFGSASAPVNGDLVFSNTGNIAMGAFNRKFLVNNRTEFAGAFTGNPGVGITMQTGTGTLVLSGTNTYVGATTVNAGTLVVTGTIATSSGVSVGAGATLAGESSTSGLTNGKVSAITLSGGSGTGGVLAPGNGTDGDLGTLYGTSLAWNGTTDSAFSQMVFDLGASNASDQLALSGAMTKGTGSIFEWDFGNTGVVGGTYTLVTAAGGFGSGGSLFNPLDFTYKNLTSGMSGTFTIDGGNSLRFTTFSAVPEPTSAIAGLLLGAGLLRRRRA